MACFATSAAGRARDQRLKFSAPKSNLVGLLGCCSAEARPLPPTTWHITIPTLPTPGRPPVPGAAPQQQPTYLQQPSYYQQPPSYYQEPSHYQQQQAQPSCSSQRPAKPRRRQGQASWPHWLPRVHRSYPDEFGWLYEGANIQSKVEFWLHPESGVKIDYYPTTGTVKTSMDHPTQGKTQMFRRNLSNKQFERVLANPRAHTGKGYQYKHTGGYGRW